MGLVVCSAQRFSEGEGGIGDLALANARWRGVLRHPQAALTLAGLGGGTLVDAAPQGRGDVLHEVVPLVGGGWLQVDSATQGPDHVTLTGRVRSLPDRPAWSEGEERTVTWRLAPDDPWLRVEGAEALWIHVAADLDLVDGWFANDRVVVGHDGLWVEDLGGAVVAWGATGLLLATPEDAWAHRPGPDRPVSGTADGASRVELWQGTTRVGWLPVRSDGAWAGTVPEAVDALVAVAGGRAASAPAAPGEGIDLALGPEGTLTLRVGWPDGARPRPVRARWTTPDGRTADVRLPPSGGALATGPGPIDLQLSAGPLWLAWRGRVEVPPDGVADLDMAQVAQVLSPRHVAADLGWRGSRSRTVRGAAPTRTRSAVAEGLEYVVVLAEDDVEDGVAYLDDAPWIRWTDGVELTSRDGWSVAAWPWRSTSNRSGHGAPRVEGQTPEEALHAARGGDAEERTTRVDLAWMRAAGVPPALAASVPDLVALGPPGAPPFRAWSPWFAWLDAGRFVRPSGPRHWLDVGSAAAYGQHDVDRALHLGRFAAGTGAWLDVRVDGRVPGAILPAPFEDTGIVIDSDTDAAELPGHDVALTLQAGGTSIDRVTLWSGGAEVATWSVARTAWSWQGRVELGDWVAVIGWSTTSDDWVVTTPIWTRAPGALPEDNVPEDTLP